MATEQAPGSEALQRAIGVPDAGARYISVLVRSSLYGFDMAHVQEVVAVLPITRVFHAPPAMVGVLSLRGEILPVIDLGLLLGATEPTDRDAADARIVIVREDEQGRTRAGVLVDALGGLRAMPVSGLEPVPTTVTPSVRELVAGVVSDPPPCTVVSVPALLGSPRIVALADGEPAGEGASGESE